MKACVIGAGAIGGQLAAALIDGGAETSVIARGPHLAAIREQGLTIALPEGEKTYHLRAEDNAAAVGAQDAVIVAVKTPALPAVAGQIAPLLHAGTPVVFAVNGIPWWYFYSGRADSRPCLEADPDLAIWNSISPQHAVGGVVYVAAVIERPGRVAVSSRRRIVLGEPSGELSLRVTAIAETLTRGGFPAKVSETIRDDIWTKLILNLGGNLIAALAQSSLKDTFADEGCRKAAAAVLKEAQGIAQKLGCTPRVAIERTIADFQSLPHRPSTLQDLESGRPIEMDAIFSAPLALAKAVGVETPILEILVGLFKQRARAAGLY